MSYAHPATDEWFDDNDTDRYNRSNERPAGGPACFPIIDLALYDHDLELDRKVCLPDTRTTGSVNGSVWCCHPSSNVHNTTRLNAPLAISSSWLSSPPRIDEKVHRLDEVRTTFQSIDIQKPSARRPYSSGRKKKVTFSGIPDDEEEISVAPIREVIVIPSCETGEPPPLPRKRPKRSWHQLLRDKNWDRLKEEFSYYLVHRRILVSNSKLMAIDSRSSALHIATETAPGEVTLQLLEVLTQNPSNEGTPLERTRKLSLCGDANGNTPLHLACSRLEKEQDIDFAVIKNLIVVGHEALRLVNNEGNTPIHLLLASQAYCRGVGDESSAEEAVSALLLTAAESLTFQNNHGMTPLHVALSNRCHERVLYRLISYSIAAFDIADEAGMKPIHYAASYGAPLPCIELMVESLPESICQVTTTDGETPLHLLIANIDVLTEYSFEDNTNTQFIHSLYIEQILKLLVGNNCQSRSPLWIRNDEGFTPLHCCVMSHFPSDLIESALGSVSSHVLSVACTTAAHDGSTALHTALRELSLKRPRSKMLTTHQRNSLKRMITLFASPLACKATDAQGLTPLAVAVQSKYASMSALNFLLKVDPQSASVPDKMGSLPVRKRVPMSKVSTHSDC